MTGSVPFKGGVASETGSLFLFLTLLLWDCTSSYCFIFIFLSLSIVSGENMEKGLVRLPHC